MVLETAGGIGGLLAVQDPDDDGDPADPNDFARNFAHTYDGNGNVGQLVAWAPGYGGTWGPLWDTTPPTNARLAARYEYDPYGNPLLDIADANESGPYAGENPFRFSTKYWDDETGLGNWPLRYYDPAMGRWISRDPIGEWGGMNLYCFVGGHPTTAIDPRGLHEPLQDLEQHLKELREAIRRSQPHEVIVYDGDDSGGARAAGGSHFRGGSEQKPKTRYPRVAIDEQNSSLRDSLNDIVDGTIAILVIMDHGSFGNQLCGARGITAGSIGEVCHKLAPGATIELGGCNVGASIDYLCELAGACPGQTLTVCGYDEQVLYPIYKCKPGGRHHCVTTGQGDCTPGDQKLHIQH